MIDDHPVIESGDRRLVLTPRRLQALADLLDAQIMLDGAPPSRALPPAMLRIVAKDGTIAHPIACPARVLAKIGDDAAPECRWSRADRGYACSTCSKAVDPGDPRFATLASLFGDGELPTEHERMLIVAVLRAIGAAGVDPQGFAADLARGDADALALVAQASSEVGEP